MLARFFALAAAAACASAGGGLRSRALEPATPDAFLAELFESATCAAPPLGGAVSRLLAPQSFCHRQGDTASFSVACAADGRSGTLSSCSDAACRANCDVVRFISGACTSPRSIAGAFAPAASVKLTCLAAPPEPPAIDCGRCAIQYSVCRPLPLLCPLRTAHPRPRLASPAHPTITASLSPTPLPCARAGARGLRGHGPLDRRRRGRLMHALLRCADVVRCAARRRHAWA